MATEHRTTTTTTSKNKTKQNKISFLDWNLRFSYFLFLISILFMKNYFVKREEKEKEKHPKMKIIWYKMNVLHSRKIVGIWLFMLDLHLDLICTKIFKFCFNLLFSSDSVKLFVLCFPLILQILFFVCSQLLQNRFYYSRSFMDYKCVPHKYVMNAVSEYCETETWSRSRMNDRTTMKRTKNIVRILNSHANCKLRIVNIIYVWPIT